MPGGAGKQIEVDVQTLRELALHPLKLDLDRRSTTDQRELSGGEHRRAAEVVDVPAGQIAVAPRPRRAAVAIDELAATVGDGRSLTRREGLGVEMIQGRNAHARPPPKGCRRSVLPWYRRQPTPSLRTAQ